MAKIDNLLLKYRVPKRSSDADAVSKLKTVKTNFKRDSIYTNKEANESIDSLLSLFAKELT